MSENITEEMQQIVMGIIMHGGDAKGKALEAIRAAQAYDFELADQKIEEADEAVSRAHKSQTSLITKEASGEKVDVSILLIHGQDHLMNAITTLDLAKEMIKMSKNMQRLEEKN